MSNATKVRGMLAFAVSNALAHAEQDVGVLLSGGIDSASIAKLARREARFPLPCFTGYYAGEQYDERYFAMLVTEGVNHYEVKITPDDFVTYFDDMLASVRPPYAGPGTFGQWMVGRYAASHVNTVLSGEGGDELFGGYCRLLMVAGEPKPDGYEEYVLPADYPRDLDGALAYDWAALPDLLAVDEQVNGAHGLTAVAPMLDKQLVEFVLNLPARERVGKRLLKDAMVGIVPKKILGRTDKRGFPVPFVEWAQREPVRSFVWDRIGYVPLSYKPWDRQWWLDLCHAGTPQEMAA